MTQLASIVLGFLLIPLENIIAAPLALSQDSATDTGTRLQPRQVRFRQNSDGSITANIALSNAFNIPGQGSSTFGIDENINIGPNGSSFNGGQSYSSDFGGNKVAFGQTNSQNSRLGPNGFSSSGGNSASNSFQNPFFQSSNANANAFANQFQQPSFPRNFK